MNQNTNKLFKTLLILIAYFSYTPIISMILQTFGVEYDNLIRLIVETLFLVVIVIIYKKNILDGYKDFMLDKKHQNRLIQVFKWVALLFIVNMILAILSNILIGNSTDENTSTIYSLFNLSSIYIVFKTLIFATIAEELVFKKSIKDVVNNDLTFVLISSFIYTFVNIAYADLSSILIFDVIQYLLFSLILSTLYVKNNDNIFLVMVVKFVYNLIPFTILLLGV